jgi:hypothetical protein
MTTQPDHTDESILDHLSELKNYYQQEALTLYEEFEVDGAAYYFTPEGFLYCKDPGAEKMGSFFNGYLTNDIWDHSSSERFVTCSTSIVLTCRCGEKLLLLGHEADWSKEERAVFDCCGCGRKLSLRSE